VNEDANKLVEALAFGFALSPDKVELFHTGRDDLRCQWSELTFSVIEQISDTIHRDYPNLSGTEKGTQGRHGTRVRPMAIAWLNSAFPKSRV
jgi:hypothetical protein